MVARADSIRVKDAAERVREAFPFAGYMDRRETVHASVARVLLKNLTVGARVLDFGSGPCDVAALSASLGYESYACDDLMDPWHMLPGNEAKISQFADRFNVHFKRTVVGEAIPFEGMEFDMVMLHAVLEHLHDSPRHLLVELVSRLTEDGLLYVTVPNAVNIRKRLAVAAGHSNLPRYEDYYWSDGQWRGHVREYVKEDLLLLASYLGLQVVSLQGSHHMLHKVPARMRPMYRVSTAPFPGWRDTWSLIARKEYGWKPARTRTAVSGGI